MPDPESPPVRNDGGFLYRWSERKLALRDGTAIDDGNPAEEAARQQDSIATDDTAFGPQPATTLTDVDMPPVEDLDAESDYSSFLSQGVSESLRNQALKKLFFCGRFNVVDGLDDYAEDFTRFESLGDIITAEMRHRIDEAAKRNTADDEWEADVEEAGDTEPKVVGAEDASATGPGDNRPESTLTNMVIRAAPEHESTNRHVRCPLPLPSPAVQARQGGGQGAPAERTSTVDTDAEGQEEL